MHTSNEFELFGWLEAWETSQAPLKMQALIAVMIPFPFCEKLFLYIHIHLKNAFTIILANTDNFDSPANETYLLTMTSRALDNNRKLST